MLFDLNSPVLSVRGAKGKREWEKKVKVPACVEFNSRRLTAGHWSWSIGASSWNGPVASLNGTSRTLCGTCHNTPAATGSGGVAGRRLWRKWDSYTRGRTKRTTNAGAGGYFVERSPRDCLLPARLLSSLRLTKGTRRHRKRTQRLQRQKHLVPPHGCFPSFITMMTMMVAEKTTIMIKVLIVPTNGTAPTIAWCSACAQMHITRSNQTCSCAES